MSKSLYRKYRSQSLDDIVGQKGVVTALKNAIASNAISHAYLFTGPRGVGKTSIARILAFAIINKPYDIENLPIDIIEIDAASNRGIDEVRDLRDKVKIAPMESKYKVYIIDEVHMLTTHAFNALLKTLEEPPEHIVFILATTESHKLPETIVSRTQKFNFSLATIDEVTDHLAKIAKKEKINIDRPALKLIAKHSGGSLRDAISTLDHARHLGDNITADDIRTNIGIPSDDIINSILDTIVNDDSSGLLKELEIAEQDNIAPVTLAQHLILNIKKDLKQNKSKLSVEQALILMKGLSGIESKTQAQTSLFITLLSAIKNPSPANIPPVNKPTTQPTATKSTSKPSKIIEKPDSTTIAPTVKAVVNQKPPENTFNSNTKISEQPESQQITKEETTQSTLNNKTDSNTSSPADAITVNPLEMTHSTWQTILEDVRSSHNTLYSVLRMANLDLSEITNQKIILNMQFPFHHKRISEAKNKEVIVQKLQNFGIEGYEIVCNLVKKETITSKEDDFNDDPSPANNEDKALNQIREIFGPAEAI